MTFFNPRVGILRRQRRVANNRPPAQPALDAGRTGDCSQLYALLFYAARCKHSALRAPCSQRFTPKSWSNRPTLMHEASFKDIPLRHLCDSTYKYSKRISTSLLNQAPNKLRLRRRIFPGLESLSSILYHFRTNYDIAGQFNFQFAHRFLRHPQNRANVSRLTIIHVVTRTPPN